MNFLSRKFFVFIILTVVFWGVFVATIILAPAVVNPIVFMVIVAANTLLGIFYIGGNVLQKSFELAKTAIPAALEKKE